ncbi:methylated-DNA--[protein]-cysteine S-methyltransferase [Halarchaeum nitratireducens]|uniref:Methylated-DNA--protein-cysteine methyltransferase n=1 Tax=Halarchaeum nitratireducens TaxID=489913 RepID=A0A830G9T1_9EURY|nr:methylated-DNA--[protein]-cysteine S-methyltransferase [Halarchaeum nitratireducens]MBP2250543.1 methylated-DNA-[protein]-cysteine S-methyltransferase [Halarchaeum solikamskense]GGN15211.1 methylated-DNA--protein-cysteine methyltransferase [Halarchaeum nitratireducens]
MRYSAFGATFDIDTSPLDVAESSLRAQLASYERGGRTAFDVGVTYAEGFTGEVMAAMAAIPYGETRTYGDLAATLDSAAVAVGQACGRNAVPIVVPCHRVVAADGLGGFSIDHPDALGVKRRLLEHEGALDGSRQATLPV